MCSSERRAWRIAALLLWPVAAALARPPDLASFELGARVLRHSGEFGETWTALHVLDERVDTGYCGPDGQPANLEIVIALAARSEIERFAFDTGIADAPGRSAREVELAIADHDQDGAYVPVLRATLTEGRDGQEFALAERASGSFLRLRLRNNHGAEDYLELGGFHAYGRRLVPVHSPAITGVYQTERYGRVQLRQHGARIDGCYDFASGSLQGQLSGNVLDLHWQQADGLAGGARFVFSADGLAFSGMWWPQGPRTDPDLADWHGRRLADMQVHCP